PDYSSKNIKKYKPFEIQTHHACNNGGEGPDDRQETAQHNGKAAVAIIKVFRLKHILLFEKEGIVPFEDHRTGFPPEPIPYKISDNRRKGDQYDEQGDVSL